jgi:hypothetical protein
MHHNAHALIVAHMEEHGLTEKAALWVMSNFIDQGTFADDFAYYLAHGYRRPQVKARRCDDFHKEIEG